jgi:pimeloyl-ACP methyl ester carboxylesterase
VLCGAGIGAVIALDLLLRRPELVSGAILIEPPLFGLVPAATEELSEDRVRVHEALGAGGVAEVLRLYLSGSLAALGPGAGRPRPRPSSDATNRPATLFAELGATTAWGTPLSRFARASRPSVIATAPSTPSLLRDAAAALETRLADSSSRQIGARTEAPHVGAPAEVAALILELG